MTAPTDGSQGPQERRPSWLKLFGFEDLTLAIVIIGASHLAFGTLGFAWLRYLGTRYYDAFARMFGLPDGTFDLSDGRLASKGFEIATNSFELVLLYAFVPVSVLMIVMICVNRPEIAGGPIS